MTRSTRLAFHLSIGTTGDLGWRFLTALHFANLEIVESFQ